MRPKLESLLKNEDLVDFLSKVIVRTTIGRHAQSYGMTVGLSKPLRNEIMGDAICVLETIGPLPRTIESFFEKNQIDSKAPVVVEETGHVFAFQNGATRTRILIGSLQSVQLQAMTQEWKAKVKKTQPSTMAPGA